MGTLRLHSGLRERRIKAGLQQRELAERVGVSRQTLGALEAGESVPATSIALQLARVLGCRVEDIFSLGEDDSPFEAALLFDEEDALFQPRVAVASVYDRWVAHPLETDVGGMAPADGLLASTKGREARRAVRVRPLRESAALRENLFVAGCDPALALLAGHVGERWQGRRVHWVEAGSGKALDLVADRQVHVAGLHLYDEESGDYNVAPVRRRLGGRATVLVNLAVWELGLLVAAGNPRKLRGIADLARKGVRVVGRESGTGAQELFTRLAAEEGVPRRAIEVVMVARGHMAVAQAVAAGGADAGIATRAAAARHGLEFLPLAEARFDLAIPRQSTDDPRVQRLLDALGSERFKKDLGGLAGYGNSRTGQVVAEVAA